MKKAALLVCLILVISCKKESQESFGQANPVEMSETPEQLGKSIFEGKGNCVACHKINENLVGPSIQDIAKIYKSQNGDIVSFLKDDAKPLVDPSQYEVMKTSFALTKAMSDEELKGLEAYIYSAFK
ncbi:MAG: c-type cytochrome [Flavobacteriaceae bacterium]|nr:c-type cytochrome [Flavobacteriaceae bacterium]